jgi:hypothetical protein
MTAMMLIGVLAVSPDYPTIADFKKDNPAWVETCADLRATSCEIRTKKVFCPTPDPLGLPKPGLTSCVQYSLYGQMPDRVDGLAPATWLRRVPGTLRSPE